MTTTATRPDVFDIEAIILTTRNDPYYPVGTEIGWSRTLAADILALDTVTDAAVRDLIDSVPWSGYGGTCSTAWSSAVARRVVNALGA
jgi:hypothetical protein